MSEKDFLKQLYPKVLATIIGGISIVVITSMFASVYTARATTDRSFRNEKSIAKLEDEKENKGHNIGLHQTLLNATISNAEDIKSIEDKVDKNQTFIVKELLEIKGYVKTR